ncbi:hypothetical protein JW899_03080 [Candidatus Uhrbacteria bacterium]|nr:hypothetical protein [Candidatus Uhrbacteria bacterium]
MPTFRRHRHTGGFSILEAIISVAVFGILASGVMMLVTGPMSVANKSADRQRALFLSEEGVEASRSIRDEGWAGLAVGSHGLSSVSGRWRFSGPEDSTPDGFTRVVTVSEVRRDTEGNIVVSGGNPDKRTRQVTSTVSWDDFGQVRSVSSVAYLTDWDTYDWRQSTDGDFLPGTRNGTRISGSGEPAAVELAPAEGKLWTSAEGNLITHTTDTDWSGGSFADTELVGSGTDASIAESGPMRWVEIRSGKSFFHTTDTDFLSGTFSGTVAEGTGDLGSLTVDRTEGWSVSVSPTGQDIRGIYMLSDTDGWAVGTSGTILRWDGTVWSVFADTGSQAWSGVSCVSPDDCWASGDSGRIARWNGTSWSQFVDLGNQAWSGLACTSSSDCWAVGNSGRIARWNGTSWSQFVDLGNQAWSGVSCVSSDDCWASGNSGRIARWNGTSWSQFTDTGSQTWKAVRMVSAADGWITATNGNIRRWNGSSWVSVASPTAQSLNGLFCLSANVCLAVGGSGIIIGWNGTAWSQVTDLGGQVWSGVACASSDRCWTVGDDGNMARYGPHFLPSGTYLSDVFDAGETVDWGYAFWSESLPDNTELTVAFRSGNVPVPGGSWSAWSSEYTDPVNTQIPSPSSRYFQYRVSMSTGDLDVAPRLEAIAVYYNQPQPVSYFDMKTIGDTDGWAVGQGGAIARFDGSEWSSYPSPTSSTLYDVDFASADDVWAVGANGTVIHWNGSSWGAVSSPTSWALYGIDILPDGTGWAVGRKGTVIELRGNGNWYSAVSPTARDLNAVSLVSGTDGWAVGNQGSVIRWNGTAWSTVSVSYSQRLNGVHAVSGSFAVTVGQGGTVFVWDGSSWVGSDSTVSNELLDVWCRSTDDCWAVGIQQTFVQWDGTGWSQYYFSNPSNPVVQGVFLPLAGDGWATGEGGALYRYTAYRQPVAYYTGPAVDSGEDGAVWNTVSWESLQPLLTGLSVSVRTGPTPSPDGSWSAWSGELSDGGGSTVTSPPGRYLQYRVTFTSGDPAATAVLQEIGMVWGAVTGQELQDTDGSAVSDVWAVGRSGTIVHYDGLSWSPAVSPTVRSLFGVAVLGANDAWAVGDSGTILRYDGSDWSQAASPTPNGLRGVDLSGTDFGFAVGDSGTILRYDGSDWSAVASPVSARLNSVFLESSDFGWAVGDSGTILHWDGVSWSSVPSPTVVRLNAVESRSVNEAWAVGNSGTIAYWDGSEWSSFSSPTARDLYGLTVRAPTDGWACGNRGVLLRDPESYPPTGTFISTVLDADSLAEFKTAFWEGEYPPGTAVTVAVRSGDVAVPDATWTGWSPEMSGDWGAQPVTDGRYWQYRLTLTTGDPALTPSFQAIVFTYMLR